MIIFDKNFFTEEEINYLLAVIKDIPFTPSRKGTVYSDQIQLMQSKFNLEPLKNNFFKKKFFSSIRINRYDETIEQFKDFHEHESTYNYVIFLNDDFEGGELEFEDGIVIKPKKGSLVYFTNNERHKVYNCKGTRLTLILSGTLPLDISILSTRRNLTVL